MGGLIEEKSSCKQEILKSNIFHQLFQYFMKEKWVSIFLRFYHLKYNYKPIALEKLKWVKKGK